MTADQTKQLSFLAEQTPQVLHDFCKLAADYLQKGPNLKIYGAAAHKLSVEPEVIRSTVECLINLLLESSKRRSSVEDFCEYVESVGFQNEKAALLRKLYEAERPKLGQALSIIGLKLPRYRNIEWRFQVEIASRSMLTQLSPYFTFHLTLDDESSSDGQRDILMQIDPVNLAHLTQELECAMQEGRSQHLRKIKRSIKL